MQSITFPWQTGESVTTPVFLTSIHLTGIKHEEKLIYHNENDIVE
jgi:hypothetical protein